MKSTTSSAPQLQQKSKQLDFLPCCNSHLHLSDTAAEFICLHCNKALCTKCMKIEQHHNDHTLVDVHKWREHMQQRLALNLQQAKKRLAALEQEETKFHSIFSFYQEELAHNEQVLKNFFSSFVQLVQDASKHFLKELHEQHQERVKQVKQAFFTITDLIHAIKASEHLFNTCIKQNHDKFSLDQLTRLFTMLDHKIKVCIVFIF